MLLMIFLYIIMKDINMNKFVVICVMLLVCMASCNNINNKIALNSSKDSIECISLQPYEDFSVKEATNLIPAIQEKLNKVYAKHFEIKVMKPKILSKEAYYAPRNRYLSNVLLRDLNCNSKTYIIGLTHKDVSHKIHGSKNYGIMGLTPLGGNKSIVSDYRCKGNSFIAVIIHEFGHGFYKARHCSNPNCIMCDYQKHKGKPFVFGLCENHQFMHATDFSD